MKIAVHVHDLGPAGNIGGPVTTQTAVVNIPDEQLPKIAKDYLTEVDRVRKYKGGTIWLSISFSLFTEE